MVCMTDRPKIVITGGLGFIFSHVTEYFLTKGWEVHVFDDLSVGSHPELLPDLKKNKKFHFYEENVSFWSVENQIADINPDYIVHAAAISDVDYSIKNPSTTLKSNNDATVHVFEAARKCSNLKKLLYVSTDEVLGECDHPKDETEILFPKNPYSVSKAFGSILRLAYDNSYPELKDKTCETRFCNVYGPRQDDRKIIPAIKQGLDSQKVFEETGFWDGKAVRIHNAGQGYRQWIYIKDIPPVIELLLEKGHRTYNITSGFGCTVNELMTIVEDMTGKVVPKVLGDRPGMDIRYEMSGERIFKEFGWKPSYTFEQGLKETLCQ